MVGRHDQKCQGRILVPVQPCLSPMHGCCRTHHYCVPLPTESLLDVHSRRAEPLAGCCMSSSSREPLAGRYWLLPWLPFPRGGQILLIDGPPFVWSCAGYTGSQTQDTLLLCLRGSVSQTWVCVADASRSCGPPVVGTGVFGWWEFLPVLLVPWLLFFFCDFFTQV